jgi:hypothetical protein
MTDPRFLASADVLDRRVLFAVEVIDPVTQAFVSQGITVTAVNMQAKPIVSRSGRFVWLVDKDAWPGDVSVDPGRLPYAPETQAGPPKPPDILAATAAQRLVRIMLRPTYAYAFDTGPTVVRGTLKERLDYPSPTVSDAIVQLAWQDATALTWAPGPPAAGELWPVTDANGGFAALLRLSAVPPADPDLSRGLLKARVQITRVGVTRVTPDDYPFLPDAADAGRVPEGRLLSRDVMLGWNELTPI